VKDTGIGIPPEKLKKLALSGRSLPSPGTEGETGSGYGLALCKEFIRELKGTIQFESQPDVGTDVIVEFPAA
jgi:signal transduction histidine kinase